MKYFIERARSRKWRMTGMIWWNLIDGWPQFSDAVVDYYYCKKLAYHYIKCSQQPVCLILSETDEGEVVLYGVNDTRDNVELTYTVKCLWVNKIFANGKVVIKADAVMEIAKIRFDYAGQDIFAIEWDGEFSKGKNHYLYGKPQFELSDYVKSMREFSNNL